MAELPTEAKRARAGADARDVDGGGGICSHAAQDAARAIFLVAHAVIVNGSRVGAPRVPQCTETVVDCGRRVVIGTRAVSAPAVGASAPGSVGALVEVQSGRIEAAGHGADALPGQRGHGVVIDRARVNTPLVEARAVLEGGQRSVIARLGLHASWQHRRAAAVIEGRRRLEGVKAAVHAATLNARAVVHHGEVVVVQCRASGTAIRRG